MSKDVDYQAALKKIKIIPTLRINFPTLEVLGPGKMSNGT